MVSKIAVIALVGIVSVPILLGFALNLNEITVNKYISSGDSVNVTPLLENGLEYNYVHGDIVDLNTHFYGASKSYIYPIYAKVGSTYTSLKLNQVIRENTNYILYNPINTSNFSYYNIVSYYDPATSGANLVLHYDDGNNTWDVTINKFISFTFDKLNNLFTYNYYIYNSQYDFYYNSDYETAADSQYIQSIEFTYDSYYGTAILTYNYDNVENYYVDISSGFYLNRYSSTPTPTGPTTSIDVSATEYKSLLMTFDLSTITDSSYFFQISSNSERYGFVKSTDSDGPHWAIYKFSSGLPSEKITDIYYDQSKSSNAYQVYMHDKQIEFRYIGSWTSLMGLTNYYQNYIVETSQDVPYYSVGFSRSSPLMRIDDAVFGAFNHNIIDNQTYDPSAFRTNPITTISNLIRSGNSLTFGGNTYNVVDGNLQIGTRELPINNMVFESVPVLNGFENKINGYVVSTTAAPSTITFGGKWTATIITDSLELSSYTSTQWTPGQFGWDGIDQNFLMVGMLTAIGVFVGLGIYARSHNMRIWPVLLVCGGAILLFFCMI